MRVDTVCGRVARQMESTAYDILEHPDSRWTVFFFVLDLLRHQMSVEDSLYISLGLLIVVVVAAAADDESGSFNESLGLSYLPPPRPSSTT